MVGLPNVTAPRRKSILLLEDDPSVSELFSATLTQAGYAVDAVSNGLEGLQHVGQAIPDLIISDIRMPEVDGLQFLERVRAQDSLRAVPVILLTGHPNAPDAIRGFELGADDYVPKQADPHELLMRVSAKITRPPMPLEALAEDRQTGLPGEKAFLEMMETEVARAGKAGRPCTLVQIRIYERAQIQEIFGSVMDDALSLAFGKLLRTWAGPQELLGHRDDGSFLIFMPGTLAESVQRQLFECERMIMRQRFSILNETLIATPLCGYADIQPGEEASTLIARTEIALSHAAEHIDLRPIRYEPGMIHADTAPVEATPPAKAMMARLRLPSQILATYLIGWGIPFAVLAACNALGFDVSGPVYIFIVALLLAMCIHIWLEGIASLSRREPPELATGEYGTVSAIIAAYLPNEALHIETTIRAFLAMDYPRKEIILAYNTPFDMPVEERLRELARENPEFIPMRVDGSTSKAQNVNAALSIVTGSVVSIYDADHQPETDSFRRAWRWIASGADVVQGRCCIRNGGASWVSRLVAVEFELMYGVAHPGRDRLHGFGIFGGSNGFWRTSLLREIRMRGVMLTEDIDSSIRTVAAGHRIVNDPWLISRELAPTTFRGLTRQRLRWAQGWSQVAVMRLLPAMFRRGLTIRQRLGLLSLLSSTESFPWISMLIVPVIAFWMWRGGVRSAPSTGSCRCCCGSHSSPSSPDPDS